MTVTTKFVVTAITMKLVISAILDFAGSVALQVLSECPQCCLAGIGPSKMCTNWKQVIYDPYNTQFLMQNHISFLKLVCLRKCRQWPRASRLIFLKGMPGLVNILIMHERHFHCSCGQAAVWFCSLSATTERKLKYHSCIIKMLTRHSLSVRGIFATLGSKVF